MKGRVDEGRSDELSEVARLLSYIALLAVSVTLLIEAFAIPASRFEALGAGAFPMIVHGALILLLLAAIVGSMRQLPMGAYGRFGRSCGAWVYARRLVFALFVCFGLYLFAMPRIGYSISTFLFLVTLQAIFAPKTWRALAVGLVLAVAFSIGLNWVFSEVFNVFLPRGR